MGAPKAGRAVYLNKPPADWESDELAVAVRGRGVYGDEYAQAIVSFDVNIGIVSAVNRNHTASRTFAVRSSCRRSDFRGPETCW